MSEHKFQNDEMLYSIADYFKHQGERTERFAKYLYDDMQAYKAKVEEMQKTLEVSKETLRELYFQVGQDMDINPSAKTVYLSKIAFANNSLKGGENQ